VKQQIANKDRKELEEKMATILGENIKGLSTELQEILLDDMVTAFENRLNVLNIAHTKGFCWHTVMKKNTYYWYIKALYKNDEYGKKRGSDMRRSKLEMYVDILKVLAHRGPLKLTHVMYKANVNCSVLKEYLEFLIKQGLVEERTAGKRRVVYAITQRGITVLKYFRELKQVLPIVEEARNQAPVPF
jgi:predicted transcriptional regulator